MVPDDKYTFEVTLPKGCIPVGDVNSVALLKMNHLHLKFYSSGSTDPSESESPC